MTRLGEIRSDSVSAQPQSRAALLKRIATILGTTVEAMVASGDRSDGKGAEAPPLIELVTLFDSLGGRQQQIALELMRCLVRSADGKASHEG